MHYFLASPAGRGGFGEAEDGEGGTSRIPFGVGSPSQSPAVTALPKGEPRGLPNLLRLTVPRNGNQTLQVLGRCSHLLPRKKALDSAKNSPDQIGQGSFRDFAYSSAKSYMPSYFSRNMLNRVVSSSSLSTPLLYSQQKELYSHHCDNRRRYTFSICTPSLATAQTPEVIPYVSMHSVSPFSFHLSA